MSLPNIRHVFYLVHDLARQLRRWQEKVSREQGLNQPQLRAMAQLCDRDGISQTELAGLIESDPMTVGGVVERLEARGLVRRAIHPTDSRAKIVLITEAARALVAEVRAKATRYEPQILEGISADELQTALSVLERISANLDKHKFVFEESLK
jgi:MarR family transcriptional regulator, transcriptional regulator for hemolysin